MSQATSDFDALDELLDQVWEQPSDTLLRQQLNQLLDGNPRAQQRYLEYQLLHAELLNPLGPLAKLQQSASVSQASDTDQKLAPDWIAQLTNGSEHDPKGQAESVDKDAITARMLFSLTGYLLGQALTTKLAYKSYGVAAAILVAVTLFLVFGPGDDDTAADPLAGNPPADVNPVTPDVRPVPVATLTAERDAAWDRLPGQELYAGQRFTLTQGLAEITTQRGAVAIIEAPATIELIDSPNAIHLHTGKLVGICETQLSQGFTVHTPAMDIVDLGTEFGVEVHGRQVTATVFAGEIELERPGHATQPLVANQTATLDDSAGTRLVVEERVAEGFTLRLPRTTTAEQVYSTATPIAAWDFQGSASEDGPGIHAGDISTASGLQMTGFTGQWGIMPANQGAHIVNRRATDVGETTGVSNGITLRWAVDGVGATHWSFVHPENSHALFGDCYFILNPSRWGGAAIPWRIEGLTPGARYDLIFFGRNSNHYDEAQIAINGHDAGNGVGAAATLDDEDDANFQSVVADADGFISGTFSALENGKHAVVTGVQIGILNVPGPSE